MDCGFRFYLKFRKSGSVVSREPLGLWLVFCDNLVNFPVQLLKCPGVINHFASDLFERRNTRLLFYFVSRQEIPSCTLNVWKILSLHLTTKSNLQRDVDEDDAEMTAELLLEIGTKPATVQTLD